ncbi:MAG: orotidine-5'-phosphate decarboxylase [Planctomycetota bacterium]
MNQPPTATGAFADRLVEACEKCGTPACVGIDPVLERLPDAVRAGQNNAAAAVGAFAEGVVHAVAGIVPVVKLQSACFERYGSAGFAALERTADAARRAGLVVILDAKRGDISLSAGHYAAAAKNMGADAATVNAYMGRSAVEPFLEAGLGVFVLVRTSNPDAGELQDAEFAEGGTVSERVAGMVAELGAEHFGERGLSGVGAVVGATAVESAAVLRRQMPHAPFLVPGLGAQGGEVGSLDAMTRPEGGSGGLIPTASRSVLYPESSGGDWRDDVRAAATRFGEACAAALA